MAENDKEYRVNNAGKLVEQKLLEYLASEELHSDCYAFRTRVKPVDKLIEKVQRKIQKNDQYDLLSITDVVGLRVVTLFRQDMEVVARKILGMICDARNNVFQERLIEEVIIYAVDHKHDSIVQLIKSSVTDFISEDQIKIEESEAGYSSIHIVTRYGADLSHDLPTCDFSGYKIPVEIQIRTVFEDAWGEIDHKYGYEHREGKSTDQKIHNSEHVKKHLRLLKSFVDACAQYADVIRQEATDVVLSLRSENILDADDSEFAVMIMQRFGVDSELIEKFSEIRQVRKEAEELQKQSSEESSARYNDAIAMLQEFKSELMQEGGYCQSSDRKSEVLRHFVMLDQALCLLSNGHSASLQDAITIYSELLADNEKYPIVNYRLGQAYSKLKDFSVAAKYYNRSKSAIEEYDASSESEYFLPEHDKEYILKTLPKVHGYSLWKHSFDVRENAESMSDTLSLLADAYLTTSDALSHSLDADAELGIHNNLLYYAVDYVKCGGTFDSDSKLPKGAIETHLKYLESKIELSTESDVSRLDTMAYAYQVTKDPTNAKAYAEAVQHLILSGDQTGGLDDITHAMLKRAYDIVNLATK